MRRKKLVAFAVFCLISGLALLSQAVTELVRRSADANAEVLLISVRSVPRGMLAKFGYEVINLLTLSISFPAIMFSPLFLAHTQDTWLGNLGPAS